MVQRVSSARRAEAAVKSEPRPEPGPVPMKTAHDSGRTVTVACKIPNGIVMQLYEMRDGIEPGPGGVRTIKIAHKTHDPIKINGPALAFGEMPRFTIICGFALTPGVDAVFWEKWKDQNFDNDAVKAGLITAWPTVVDAEAYARDHKTLKSGLEPIDPNNTPPGLRHPYVKIGKKTNED